VLLSASLSRYYLELRPPARLPKSITTLHPQAVTAVQEITRQFFSKFYHDANPRRLILGINPGRLGAGITGINFTAPRQLQENCGISHALGNSSELSAEFIYEVIQRYGGPTAFYAQWHIGAVCPLGFIKNGKNLNYYDDSALLKKMTPFIAEQITQQVILTGNTDTCICLGEGKNYDYLCRLNEKHQWFNKICPLPHPRFIMQYKRKEQELYISRYLQLLQTGNQAY
jgi:hypothetical protein